jgi:hypothetical protein
VSAKKTAQAPAKAEDVPRQRPTNNQLLCVSRRTASRERAPGRAGARNLRIFDVARGAAGARRRGCDRARARAPSPRRDFFPLPAPATTDLPPSPPRDPIAGTRLASTGSTTSTLSPRARARPSPWRRTRALP